MHDGTLVAVCAHADDAELNAGGTLAKWAAGGGDVQIVMVTNNCSGNIIPPSGDERAARRLRPAETMAIRRAEQEAAAALIGARVHWLDYCQRHFWDGERQVSEGYRNNPVPPEVADHPPLLIAYREREHIERLADLLVSLHPAVVLTQPVVDLDPEHHAVAAMAWAAFRSHEAELRGVPLRCWAPGSSCPEGIIDPGYDHIEAITGFYERKLELFACHASQATRLRIEMIRRRAAQWGKAIGVRYAEPFTTANV